MNQFFTAFKSITQPKQQERALSYVLQRRCAIGKQKSDIQCHEARQCWMSMARIWVQMLKTSRRVCAGMLNHCRERATLQLIPNKNEIDS